MKALSWALLGLAVPVAVLAASGPEQLRTRTEKLPNGLQLVLAPDTSAAALHVAMWYRAGSRDERPGRAGLAFLVEQLSSRGPGGSVVEARSRAVAAAGGSLGSLTTPDYTVYQCTIPFQHLDLALQLEAARMAKLETDPEHFRAQHALAAAKVRQRSLAPGAVGLDRLYASAFHQHPYGASATARAEDLESLTIDDCRGFFGAFYAPGNAVLTLTGRFEPAAALAMARKLFVTPRRPVEAAARPPEPAQDGERRSEVRVAGDASLLFVGWPAVPDSSRDAAAFELLATLMVRGAASRLSEQLVDEGLCSQVHGALDARADPGLFYLAAVLRPRADRAQTERALWEEIEHLRTQPVSPDELERSRNLAEAGWLVNWQTALNRGQWIGQSAARFADPRQVGQRLRRLHAVTAADILRAAQTYLLPEHRNVVWVLPEQSTSGGGE